MKDRDDRGDDDNASDDHDHRMDFVSDDTAVDIVVDTEVFRLSMRQVYKHLLVELFERVTAMLNMDRIIMGGMTAVKIP
ncbi:hypothetical protein BGZ92_003292 [Podila epicladia]|nr:hypothetical protein BGZ92_003292 [Podila epicladia]